MYFIPVTPSIWQKVVSSIYLKSVGSIVRKALIAVHVCMVSITIRLIVHLHIKHN